MGIVKIKGGIRRMMAQTILVSVVAFSVTAPGARAETLADALVSAYKTSGLLDQNRALLRAADEDVALAAAALKPVIGWTASITQSIGRARSATFPTISDTDALNASGSLMAEQLLYDFGASAFGTEAAKETVLATRETLVSIEQDVLLRAVEAYMGVIEAAEFVDLRQNNLRLLGQELRAAQNRFEVGEVTRTDVALAEAQLANAQSGLATAKGNFLIAVEEFRSIIGRPPGSLTPPPQLPDIASDLETAKALAVRRHPALRAVQHRVSAAELQIRRAEANTKPTVNLQGAISANEALDSNAFNTSASLGINAGGTIYAGGAQPASIRRAQALRDSERGNLHVVRRNIEQNVGNAYARLASARATLAASDGQVRAARIAFRGVREEATLGARTTLDVLDAEQALLDAEATRISAQSQLYVASYAVLSSVGQLTARALGLPVQLYDPAEYYNLVKDGPSKRSKQGAQLDRVLQRLQKN